jgi:hypothetical protein
MRAAGGQCQIDLELHAGIVCLRNEFQVHLLHYELVRNINLPIVLN